MPTKRMLSDDYMNVQINLIKTKSRNNNNNEMGK